MGRGRLREGQAERDLGPAAGYADRRQDLAAGLPRHGRGELPCGRAEHGAGTYGKETFGAVFRTIEQARAFIDIGPLATDYEYRISSDHAYPVVLPELAVVEVELYSQTDVASLATTLRENTAKKDRNDRLNTEYCEATRATEEAAEELYEDWHKCQAKDRRFQQVMATFAEYMEMTDNDKPTAMRFLNKAYTAPEIYSAFEWSGVEPPSEPVAAE